MSLLQCLIFVSIFLPEFRIGDSSVGSDLKSEPLTEKINNMFSDTNNLDIWSYKGSSYKLEPTMGTAVKTQVEFAEPGSSLIYSKWNYFSHHKVAGWCIYHFYLRNDDVLYSQDELRNKIVCILNQIVIIRC